MALSEGDRDRAAAYAGSKLVRPIRHVVGTVARCRPGRLDVFQADGSIQRVRVGQRTLFRLAGQTLARTDRLQPGRSVRVAYVDTETGPLAVMVELIGSVPARGGRRQRLALEPSAWGR